MELKKVIGLILPEGLKDYFDLVDIEETEEHFVLSLDELNIPPEAFKNTKTISKGFFDARTIRDFPLRGKPCYLKIRRRKWIIEDTGRIIFNDWSIAHTGTRMAHELTLFFKEVNRQYSH
jgi:hypothetical protein